MSDVTRSTSYFVGKPLSGAASLLTLAKLSQSLLEVTFKELTQFATANVFE